MKKLLVILIVFIGFSFKANAQIATAEKYGIKVEMFLDGTWEETETFGSYRGYKYCSIAFKFVVSGENSNFSKILINVKLLDAASKYGFILLDRFDGKGYNGKLNISDIGKEPNFVKIHQGHIDWFNSNSTINPIEIKDQRLGNYIFAKENIKMNCTALLSEKQLKECFKIEIIEVY